MEQPNQITQSNLAIEERRSWLLDRYLTGHLPYKTRQEYMEKYQLSKGSYDRDVEIMYQTLAERGERDVEQIISKHLDILYDMIAEARESGQLSVAGKLLKEVRETIGLTPAKTKSLVQNNTQTNNINLPAMSVDEIKSLLNIPVSNNTKENSAIDITDTESLDEDQ